MNELSPQQRARNYASHVRADDKSYGGMLKETQAYYAWIDGYYNGTNDVLDKWNTHMACQPPPPIKMDANELSIESYKGFLRRKINKDSKGSWWAKVKLWYKFLIA